ncbi:MAG: hypothetical protein JNL58_11215 [Planctomyces sp.]|nr:hypothetical protein [Planctomyces sp.]
MPKLFRQISAVFWITAIILAWWFLPAYPRYEIPVSNSKVVLTGDSRTLFVATLERPPQGDTQKSPTSDATGFSDPTDPEPPPGTTQRIALYRLSDGCKTVEFEVSPSIGTWIPSADGATLVGISQTGLASVYETASGKLQTEPFQLVHINNNFEAAIALDATGKRLIFAGPSENSGVTVIDLSTGSKLNIPQGKAPVAITSSGSLIAASTIQNSIVLLDPVQGTPLAEFSPNPFPVNALSFSSNGKLLASAASCDGSSDDPQHAVIRLYDCISQRDVATIPASRRQIDRVQFRGNDTILYGVENDIVHFAWSLTKLPPQQVTQTLHPPAFTADETFVATTQQKTINTETGLSLVDQYLEITEPTTGTLKTEIRPGPPTEYEQCGQLSPVDFTSDGSTLLLHVTELDSNIKKILSGRFMEIISPTGPLNMYSEIRGINLNSGSTTFRIRVATFFEMPDVQLADSRSALLIPSTGNSPADHRLAVWDIPPRHRLSHQIFLSILSVLTVLVCVRHVASRSSARYPKRITNTPNEADHQ